MKKMLGYVLGVFIVVTSLFSLFSPIHSFAAEKSSTVTYQYIDINSLTQSEKNQIITSAPNQTATADKENIQLVYQSNVITPNSNQPTSQLTNNTFSKPTLVTKTTSSNLPKAGDTPLSPFTYFLGFTLIILFIGLSIWKRKIRTSLLLFIIVSSGTFSAASYSYAAELHPKVIETIKHGLAYNYTPEVVTGYSYIGYIIQKENNPTEPIAEKGTVTVKNITEDGTLLSTETYTVNVGEAYEIVPKEIAGYTLSSPTDPKTGMYVKKGIEIIFLYKKNVPIAETGILTVKNTTENGTLISSETLTGNVGDSYEISPKEIDGFDLVSPSDPQTGVYIKNGSEIIFIYKVKTRVDEIGILTVKSVDEDGNLLSQIVTFSGNVGTPYEVEPMFIDGYTLISQIGTKTGTYVKEGSELIFIYRKNAPVTINLTVQSSNPASTPTLNTQTRGYIYPNYYKALYYDNQGNLLKTEEIHEDTTLGNQFFQYNSGESYSFYSKIYFECYAAQTNERLAWGDYQLLADTPELTSGIAGSTDLTINYTFYDLSYP
ncbi:hypothetical protein IGL98_000621 [Enterococcus sp. DIV0840]|uniref:MucBP domain-containing protein n=1 Tax=unclassified Enterococcus TaxID=2608891 RepID=UPI001A8C2F4D|nr:MucBP domain-containing protein [Enterococcus sp. DIV0849a]MBO0434378.1 MucBP domain-containing protein [Enterococcus sp. DIV0849a]